MSQQIKLIRSNVPGKKPDKFNLNVGELALNTADGLFYFKRGDDTVQTLVSTNAVIEGDILISGDFYLTGSAQFSGSVLTIGDSSFSGSINVSSSATFRGPINLYPTEAPTTGEYSASFYVTSSTNDLWIADQSSSFNFTSITDTLKSGIIAGGVVSTGSSNTVFNITSGSGQIVDINKDGIYGKPQPTIKYVEWDTFEDQSLTYLSTQPTTWLLIDSDGNLVQQPTTFTDSQYETHIIIGAVIHPNNTNISLTKTFPVVAYGSAQQFEDFTRIFGPIKIEGYGLSASGSSLSVNRASGKAFSLGRNYLNNPESPNIINDNAKTKCLFYRYYRSGSEFITDNNAGAGYSVVDPGYYDDGTGTLAAVPGGQYTVQRIFYFPGQTDLLGIYYGRATYNSLLSAEDGISEEPFSEIENTRSQAILVGYLLVKSGATNLSNTNDAKFVSAGLFRDSGTSGGGGGEGANSLDDLDDVTITSVSSGDLLRYTGAGWENTKGLSGSYSVTGSLLINGTPVTGSFSAGNGLTLSGTTFSLNTGSNHFILGTRKQISVTDTTGASGINLDYNQSTGVLSGSLLNSSIYIGAGNGLTGDGSVSLGSSASLAIGAGTGITVNSNDVQLKNAGSLTGNKVLKWDSGNNQLTNSTITDDGTDVSLTGDLTVGGTLTAQEFYTEFVSSSIIYESGSTKFGDTSDDTHERTGSLNISGSVDTTGNVDANTFSIDGTTVIDSSTNFTGSNAIFSGNLDVAGNTDIDGTLTVLGSTELGNSSTGDTHSITGITSVTGSFAVDNISLDGQQISSLTGDLELNSQGVVDIKTNITASGNNLEFNHTGTGNFTFSSENGNILIESTQFSGDDVIVAGNIAINGGDITTTDTTANIFNTNATSLNLAGAATSIEIGSNTGTTSINHNLTVDGNTTLGNADADRVDILGETIALSGSNVTLEHDSPNGEFRIQTLGGTNNKLILSSSGDIDIEQSMTMKNIDTSFQSVGYQSGFAGQGFDINFTSQSSAEFDNLTVRGSMRVFELIINQIRATNGSLFVSSVGKVDDVVDLGGDNYALIFDTGSGTVGHGFAENDVIRSQQVDRSAIGEAGVTQSLQGSLVYRSDLTVTSVQDLKVITASLDPGSTPPSSSFDYVRLGNTTNVNRQGNVYLTSDDNYAPFIDVVDGITDHDDWNNSAVSGGVKVRVGKIDGINSPEFGDLTGYGMWASGSVYLEGSINATGGLVGGWAIEPGYLESNNIKLQSSGSAGGELISIGSAASMTGNGVFLSGSGDFNLQADTNEYIRQSNNLLDIKSSEFSLSTGQLTISGSSSDGFISLGTLTDSTTVSNTNNGFFVSSSGEVLIKGGSIADNKFIKVGSSGIDIKSTDFGLKAGTLTVSGSSSTGFIKIGSLTNATTIGTTNSGFYADNSGNVLIKGSSNGSNYLKIDGSGTIDLNSDNFTLTGGSDLKLTNDAGGLLTFGDIVYANAAVAISGSGEFKFEVDADNKIEQSGGTLNIRAENLVAKGNSVEISGSNFHLLNGNITASNVDLSGNITATTGNIGGFAITSDAITGSGFLLSGSATGNEFFISASNFNVKANGNLTASNAQITGDITATSGQIAGFTISGDVIAGVSYSIDASAGAEGEYFISSSDVKIEGNGDAVFGEYTFSKFNDENDLNGLTRNSDSTNIKILEGRDANGHGALLGIGANGDFYIAPISSSVLSGSGWNGFTRELKYSLANDRWEIEQNTYIDGDLEVTGNISGSSFDSSGNVTIGGNLTVVGDTIITGSVTGHPVISPVASDSNNSNGVVVQDLTFDEFGHTNTIGTVDLDNRYLQLSGGTLTGDVSSNSQISSTKGTIGFANLANAAFLAGTTSNGIGIDSNEIRSKGADLYIGTIDADKIDFGTGGVVSQVVIASGGNLGVGIDTPSSKLHVSGSSDVLLVEGSGSTLFDVQGSQGQLFSVTDNLTGTLFSVNDISGIPILSVDSDDTVTMGTFGANALVVTGSRVGIGTTSPSAKLEVDGTGTLFQVNSASSREFYIDTTNPDHLKKNQNLVLSADPSNVHASTKISFRIDNDDKLTILDSGNVGIGTTSPGGKLNVAGGKSLFSPAGDTNSGINSITIVSRNPNDSAFTANALTAYNASTSWDIGDRSTYTVSSRVKNSSIYTYAGEHGLAAAATQRFVQFNSSNTGPLLYWVFYQYDGSGTTSADLKKPSKLFEVQAYEAGSTVTKLILNGDGDLTLSGNLDINGTGTSTIDGNLTIGGTVTAQEFHTEFVSASIIYQSGSTKFGDTSDDVHSFSGSLRVTGSGDHYFTDGNVGIGTTSPGALLDVAGNTENTYIQVRSQDTSVTAIGEGARVRFSNSAGTFLGHVGYLYRSAAQAGMHLSSINNLYFEVNGSTTPSMTVTSAGNVGIGTTSPGAHLHIYGAGDEMLRLADNSTTGNPYLSFYQTTTRRSFIQHHDTDDTLRIASEYGAIDFRTGTGGSEVQRMIIDSSGNVGIGTTSPLGKLHVENSSVRSSVNGGADNLVIEENGYSGISILSSNANAGQIHFGDQDAENVGMIQYFHSDNSMRFSTGGGGERMRIDSSGNVGIGTTSPSTALEVNGTATVTALVETSTRELKENIETLEDQSSIVDSLQPVSYTWKESKKEDFGLVAEDVEEIAPHLVHRNEDGKPTGIKYSKLSVLLLDVVQKQNTLINDLNERITKLENERGS